ncbi:MotA/TolQ/ExbB proton channel family protein [Aquincola sp. S2]|uniref:Biopolymer transport protein ExbB n=1 Tax=Pseudaquabacterium terrae TaxID=2732868 RepID=A0ABX2EQR7_9BURK|nr:MotA/TolQ/ExbB proton channel family protein [Aquabacterium terrae]NRF70882.1 MotA/TolQ/ExbB proton channel family protein [Aquabacterium terrae]
MFLNKLLRAPLAAALLAIAALVSTTAPTPALAQAASAPAAEAAAPAVATAPAVKIEKESVANPYGIEAMWKEGDFVTRGTLIIMIIMSMGSWYIMFTKLWEQSKLLKAADKVTDGFWKSGSVAKGASTLDEGSAFRFIAESGLKADEHHEGTLTEQIDRHTWIGMSVQRSVDNINSRLQDGLAFLATVGSTAPFVGLFGTVWGIYHALTAIGISGQASIDKVAGPVGEALIMTAFGLAVAVPAVMGYNWLIRRNKSVMERVRAFSADIHNVLLAGKR